MRKQAEQNSEGLIKSDCSGTREGYHADRMPQVSLSCRHIVLFPFCPSSSRINICRRQPVEPRQKSERNPQIVSTSSNFWKNHFFNIWKLCWTIEKLFFRFFPFPFFRPLPAAKNKFCPWCYRRSFDRSLDRPLGHPSTPRECQTC